MSIRRKLPNSSTAATTTTSIMDHQICGPIALLLSALILCQSLFNSPLGPAHIFQQAIATSEVVAGVADASLQPIDELASGSLNGVFESTRISYEQVGSGKSPSQLLNDCKNGDGNENEHECSDSNSAQSSNTSSNTKSSQSQTSGASVIATNQQVQQQLQPKTPIKERDAAVASALLPEAPSGKSSVVFDLNATDSTSSSTHDEIDDDYSDNGGGGDNDRPAARMLAVSASSKVEQNSDCALVLKRTYIIKNPSSDEWGDKFVFNDVDPDVGNDKVHKADLCIKYTDVDKAIEEAKHKIKFEKPSDIDSLEISADSIGAIGELNLATGQILTQKFDLSHDEILNALPMIDMSSSKFFTRDLCPKHVKPMTCTKSRYRTMSAHCNNLKHPSWGASKTPYSRYLPPDYADGINMPRADRKGRPLPSARLLSATAHHDVNDPTNIWTSVFANFGQLINHDMTRHAVSEAPDCCPKYLKGRCMPIPVPPFDLLYHKFNVKCLKFDRSLAAIRPRCLLGMRAQINMITSPIDASFTYGSTKAGAAQLRTFSDGKLKAWHFFEKPKLKPLLPPQTEDPDKDCIARPKHLYCFAAGDIRVNENPQLTVLQTVYMREHNRIAKQLAQLNVEWDDDKIYHETRHIVAAITQHILTNEFLPTLLGQKIITEYQLKPTDGYWGGYDPGVTTSTGTAFAAAALRYGHSMVEGVVKRYDKMGKFLHGDLLRFLFKQPFLLYQPGVIDQLIMGMVITPTEQTDPWVTEELAGHLFQPPKAKFGHDLAAINIQRGRDQGVPGYNDWREWCGLPRAKTFDDFSPLLMNQTAFYFAKIYKHVDDVDLWSGGISERKLPGVAVGPTLACIMARQFLNTKRGDRFWYENPGQPSSFTLGQLKEIKKMTLAKLLCTNGDDIPKIQPSAMRLPHPIYNAKVPCESLPSINLKLWDSSHSNAI